MSQRNEGSGIILGLFLLLGMHFAAFFGLCLLIYGLALLDSILPNPVSRYLNTDYRFLFLLSSPGLTQLIYVIPVVLWLKRQQRWGWMKGIIIGAVLTALLNGGCWLWFVLPK